MVASRELVRAPTMAYLSGVVVDALEASLESGPLC